MRKIALSLLAAGALVVPAATTAATPTILVKDDFFKPKSLTVKKDTKVRWVWKGSNAHNVKLTHKRTGKVVKSKFKTKGDFAYTFTRRGTWKMLCEVHPITMTGKVVVE